MEFEHLQFTPAANAMMTEAINLAAGMRHEFVTPEHLLHSALFSHGLSDAIVEISPSKYNYLALSESLRRYISSLERVPDDVEYDIELSSQLNLLLQMAFFNAENAGRQEVDVPHLINAMLDLDDSNAAYLLLTAIDNNKGELIRVISKGASPKSKSNVKASEAEEFPEDELDFLNDVELTYESGEQWKDYVTCINDIVDSHNPLIGREEELERTIRTLCRKEKNNPLHVGEPGVGKTALVYGLARLINDGKVPERLRESKIYSLDIGNLVAGTQYRGDFERRVKMIMEGLRKEKNPIVYIDEIHTLIGAGGTGENSLDGANMLKQYLEGGDIRFIGSTTYEEYNRQFSKSKGIVRRFLQIDIEEPSEQQSIDILKQLKPNYEQYHGVRYSDEAIEAAVRGSARHIPDRRLPDKAIDIIDEAGAYRQLHPGNEEESNLIDKPLIADILAKVCKVEILAEGEEKAVSLQNLEQRISSRVFGQDAAIRSVSESVLLAKAGLTDRNKPLASLLFVGPTGVGKTEIAKVLADELGIELIRFDMSEYAEKHTVAKLIGSPAGYVGYDDGGLLTDAIRRRPESVLLLDEIEKAHPDIYNILLQVMDYGKLSDNKGRQADFRNVIIIMTSNAGAQFAGQANVGFGSRVTAGDAMMTQVKKTFKPEFINRLSGTVVFNDMNDEMALLIFNKKLGELQSLLKGKNVRLELTDEARDYLLKAGITRQYGAREIERVINSRLKPLLMKEILFGTLKDGGVATVSLEDSELKLD